MKPTIKDVARLAGVSVGTASKVINRQGNVAAGLQERVREAIRLLNYHPNAIARSLKSSTTHTVAILLGDITNPFQMTMAKGVEETVSAQGYQLLIGSTRENPEVERQKLLMLHEKQVEGVIVCSTGQADEEICALLRGNVQVVLVDRPLYRLGTDIVADDSGSGMELLVRHLFEAGHRRIGIVHGSRETVHGQLRYEAAMQALARWKLDRDPELQFDGGFTFEGGMRAVDALLGLNMAPTALLAANNNMTAGILRACRDRGIRIPQDVSVVSFGGLEYGWNLVVPTVTHVNQSPFEIGNRAAELLLARLNGTAPALPTRLLLEPALVPGESSGPARRDFLHDS